MHFCPQEAAILLAMITGGGTFFSFIGWRLRALLRPNKHVHCDEDEACEKVLLTEK